MRFSSMILVALMNTPYKGPKTIDFIDSKDDSSVTYLVLDSCKIKIKKAELHNTDKIVKLVEETCGKDSSFMQ